VRADVPLLVKNLLFTVLVPGTVAVYVPLFLLSHDSPTFGWRSIAAAVLLCVGVSIYLWCVWDFAWFGRGTPAPIDPPQRLVVRGPYRYCRNPMYIGVLTVIAGWALLFRSTAIALYAGAVATCFHLFVVAYEEPYLRRQFGASYAQYRARVRRWLPTLANRS
jgi:protein-S-isoprenylcysteine O-methyltransferase Ste14